MRRLWWLAVLVLAGCGRSFTAPQTTNGPPPQPPQLKVAPSTLSAAPDEVDTLTVTSGVPPYTYSSELNLGPGCGLVAPSDGGALATYAACLNPNQHDIVHVVDGDGGQFDVSVSIGAPFSASQQGTSGDECSVMEVSVGGGAAPYQLLPPSGVTLGSCGDGGAPFQVVSRSLTRIAFLLPPYDPSGSNTYTYTALDAIEAAAATPNPANVVPLTVTVNTPASQLPPLVATPVSGLVRPGATITLAASGGRGEGTYHYEMAWNGNSSNGSVNGLTYTAGPNANTVDHLLLVDDDTDGGAAGGELYITVSNPEVASPVLVPQTLRTGDVDGDGYQDLMLSGLNVGASATLGFVYGGGVPTPGPNLILAGANNQVRDVTLADVTGDGLADVLVRYEQSQQIDGSGGQPNIPDCNEHLQAACGDAGPGAQYFSCYVDSNNNTYCQAPEFVTDGGQFVTSINCTQVDGGVNCTDFGVTLHCDTVADAGFYSNAPMFQCDQLCVESDAGIEICNNAVNCGPDGCVFSETHTNCYSPFNDGGYNCNITTFEPDGGSGQTLCTKTSSSSFQCGPFQCVDDQRGGYACGANDCLQGPNQGEFTCSSNSCSVPPGGPHAACSTDDHGDSACRVCGGSAPVFPATDSAIGLFESLPAGGRLSRGLMPYCGDGFPAVFAPGQLLVAGGFQVNVDEELGQIGFDLQNDGGQVMPLQGQQQNGSPQRVFVATDSKGQPWGAAELMAIRADGGELAEVDGLVLPQQSPRTPIPFTIPVDSDAIDRNMDLVGLATVDDVGGQSLYAINRTDGGGWQLLTYDPPGSACTQQPTVTDLHDVALPGGGPEQSLAPNEAVLDAVPLPSISAIALGVSQSQSFVGQRWLLLHRVDGGCSFVFDPWTDHHLPGLDTPGARDDGGETVAPASAIAPVDFNGDGLDDLCVATTAGLEFYPGAAKQRFSEGEQYGVSGLVACLSMTTTDAGALIAATDVLTRSVDLFAAADNQLVTDGGPPAVRSSIAYLGQEQSLDPAPVGIVVRNGGELWTLSSDPTGWSALRYPDALNITSTPTPVPLLTGTGTIAMVDQVQSLWDDPARNDAAYALLGNVPSGDLHAIHLVAEGDSLSVDQSVDVPGAVPNLEAFAFDSSGFRYVIRNGGKLETHEADGGVSSVGGNLTQYGDGGFWPACNADSKGGLVQNSHYVIIEGSVGCNNAIQNYPSNPCCGNTQGMFIIDEFTGAGMNAPVAGLGQNAGGSVRRAYLVTLPDGGSVDPDGGPVIIAAGFGRPGFFVAQQNADGTWRSNPATQLSANFSDFMTYPDDGGRYLGIQLAPTSLRVLTP